MNLNKFVFFFPSLCVFLTDSQAKSDGGRFSRLSDQHLFESTDGGESGQQRPAADTKRQRWAAGGETSSRYTP